LFSSVPPVWASDFDKKTLTICQKPKKSKLFLYGHFPLSVGLVAGQKILDGQLAAGRPKYLAGHGQWPRPLLHFYFMTARLYMAVWPAMAVMAVMAVRKSCSM
jgi:hypothetical protein